MYCGHVGLVSGCCERGLVIQDTLDNNALFTISTRSSKEFEMILILQGEQYQVVTMFKY